MGRYDYLCELETIIEIDKMNDRHDPKTGRFTFKPGGEAAFVPAKTAHEAVLYATQKLGFYDVDYGNMDLETINHVNLEITRIQEKYPEVRGAVRNLETCNEKPRGFAVTYISIFSGQIDIALDEVNYGRGIQYLRKQYHRYLKKGFVPEGTDYKSILWHEYGHVIANMVRKEAVGLNPYEPYGAIETSKSEKLLRMSEDMAPYASWVGKASRRLHVEPQALAKRISKIATQNFNETFAESFSEVNTTESPSKEAIAVVKASGWYR